jgi:hypothetical protein
MAVIIFGFLSEVHGKKVEGFFNEWKGANARLAKIAT